MALTDRRRKVIDAYMKCFNKKQAMLEAGYSESMATTSANTIFSDPAVQAEIKRRQNLATHRSDITLDWIVERLKDIADANVGDMIDVYSDGTANINLLKMTPELRRAITKFSVDHYTEGRGKNAQTVKQVKVDTADKLRALELLVRHLGLSKEKVSVELSGEASLVEQLHRGRSQAGLDGGDSFVQKPTKEDE